jgi:SPP1 gp7 family putative phage head morphogenesis protein
VNLGWDISGIDPDKVKSVLAKPWTLDNATFSDRLWARKNLLIDTLHTQLTQAMILGTPLDRVTAAAAAALGASKANASRLVRTEMGFFAVKAQRDALGALDVEEYQVVETLDGKTCPTCGAMDGKHFPMAQFQAGVTAPLFHPNCRGCVSPYFEDEADYATRRIARDENGKNYYVRGDMSYAEWKKAFVDGGGKTGLQNAAESGIVTSGGNYGALTPDSLEAELHGELMYKEIRKRTTDVALISNNTGWEQKDVNFIKNHMFFKKHKFEDGAKRRFDSSFEQAQAWDRLTQGKQTELDLLLLQHERLEAEIMRDEDVVYEIAHERANKKYNWQKALKEAKMKGT